MMRRAAASSDASWAGLLRSELDGVRTELTTSWTSSFDNLRRTVVAEHFDVSARRIADRDLVIGERAPAHRRLLRDMARSLESDRPVQKRNSDAVEFLMPEMVLRRRTRPRR